MAASVIDVKDAKAFDAISADEKRPVVLFMWAPWAGPCKQVDAVLSALCAAHAQLAFVRAEAEEVEELTTRYSVASVPTVLFTKVWFSLPPRGNCGARIVRSAVVWSGHVCSCRGLGVWCAFLVIFLAGWPRV